MRIRVLVIPRSRQNILKWEKDHTNAGAELLKAHLTALPVDEAANIALVALLAEKLRVPKRSITIIQGTASRQKFVEIAHLTLGDAKQRWPNTHT